jgi:dienelactone hydrolase
MRKLAVLGATIALLTIGAEAVVHAQGATDPRLARVRTNQQGDDFKPPSSKEAWLKRREEVRRRILVSCGLHPMLPRTPLHARVYGRTQREGYTVEKVVLETLPGFYLSGNLYRPTGKSGERPGILDPHGHWQTGRLTPDIEARAAAHARMGAVAFSYDMVGYADSKAFGHSFMDDELALLGVNLPGLQLWNSIRALDWLESLPDVDSDRLACTGESGGGTQTFLLCAVDDRIKVSAPVCMVSHHFQGGCTCENSPLLRVGTDNVEIAACFAPKPQILIGATGDWTSQIMERGVPEIRSVYRLFGADDRFQAVIHDAPHNYNQKSRESVNTFLKRHLFGEPVAGTVKEAAFTPEPDSVLSTWDAEHPRPASAVTATQLKEYLRGVVADQVEDLSPKTADQWAEAKATLGSALQTLIDGHVPAPGEATIRRSPRAGGHGYSAETITIAQPGASTTAVLFTPSGRRRVSQVTVVAHPDGSSGVLSAADVLGQPAAELLRRGHAVLVVEPFMAAKTEPIQKRQASQYYATYNRTVLAERVQDLLNAVAAARTVAKDVNLLGLESAGPWVLLARPLAGKIGRTAADAAGFEWPQAMEATDPMYLPAVHRYGGMKAFAALSASGPLFIYNDGGLDTSWIEKAHALHPSGDLKLSPRREDAATVAEWLSE